ncbi:class IV lanthionine synthetase LanL [Streptomyces sp. NPDC012623]|uniref:class IV lanthionine synthetase LanL n=1 Tax=unclassified Streptomyces TaxID=2593676 RepID=UPI0036A0E2E1
MPSLSLRPLVRAVLDDLGASGWTFDEDEVWCRVAPPSAPARIQGWKLHVSATALSAPHVLDRAARVLAAGGCAFKFARSLELVEEMTSASYDRAQCGKFLTAYPDDDDHFRDLAGRLDAATAGLPGPAILSDRPLRAGSLVHYRYGAFRGVPVLNNDGSFETRLREPGGAAVTDPRKPWFCPPAWAELPLTGTPGRPSAAPAEPSSVLLADRFVVKEAIRHSARGGVYRALDEHTGTEVLVKQARAHVAEGLTGNDARDLLRREAAMLTALKGVCPEVVHEFEKDGHAFLVESLISGETLTQWVRRRYADGEPGVDPATAVVMAGRLAALLAEVHRRGLVHQDFSPNNIMVDDDGRLWLIDPEWATVPGAWTYRAHTPGFAAPEQCAGPRSGPAHGPAADLYSLGAVLCHLTTGVLPPAARDDRPERSPARRVGELLALIRPERPAAQRLEPAILGLTAEVPEHRWTMERFAAFLADRTSGGAPDRGVGPATGPARRVLPAASPGPVPDGDLRRLVDDGLTHLTRALRPPAAVDGRAAPPSGAPTGRRLWKAGPFGDTTDPCAVQHGSAGVLAVLGRATELLGGDELHAAHRWLAQWTDERRESVPRLLPGLFFGRAGTAWALHDAARRLGDPAMARRAADLALAVPVRWPNPDVCHGAAGAGMAQLRFWQATHEPAFLDRIVTCADGLAGCAETVRGRIVWPVPADFDSALAGARHLGFAHGVAGVASFLLGAAEATGNQDYADLAAAAGATLVAEAERGPWGARWRADLDHEPGSGLLYHWCSGSTGVGTFLLRLWRATGDDTHLRLAEQAGAAVHAARWTASTAACHGIAGDGDFLLDLADALPDGPYRSWAGDLASVLRLRAVVRDELLLVPDESGTSVRPDARTGVAGAVSFLLRLLHGGPAPWMPDPTTGSAAVPG